MTYWAGVAKWKQRMVLYFRNDLYFMLIFNNPVRFKTHKSLSKESFTMHRMVYFIALCCVYSI